ncbi:MAG TPA: hypothetical protein VIR58_06835, partial [Acidimicrobiales bacterium]
GEPPVASGLVDGSISGNGYSCTWSATTSAEPPQTLVIDSATVNPPGGDAGCTTGMVPGFILHSDATATFDDGSGTVTIDRLDISVETDVGACRYEANGIVLGRDGSSRGYFGQWAFSLASGAGCSTDDLHLLMTFS